MNTTKEPSMERTPVTRKTIAEEIVLRIREMVQKGNLRPGDRLPAERKLAEVFDVSRTTVREAIKILSESGILVSRQGAGTFVNESGGETNENGPWTKRHPLREVFETRKMLEPEIAAMASRHATPNDITRLEAILREQEELINAGGSGAGCDHRFHALLAEISGNGVLQELVSALHDEIESSRSEALQSPERQRASLAAHWAIVAAVKHGYGMQAERAMREHLDEVEQIIFLNQD